jgi:hypothetical protein
MRALAFVLIRWSDLPREFGTSQGTGKLCPSPRSSRPARLLARVPNLHAAPLARLAQRRALVTQLPLVGTLVLVAVAYAYFSTGGSWQFRDGWGYFGKLGEAFLSGRLYLNEQPPESLLALSNPYDPAQRMHVDAGMHDASLYNGQYYLYWGPVPGVVHALWELVSHQLLTDSLAGLSAGMAIVLGFALTMREARRKYWPLAPHWVVWGSTLAFALGGIAVFLVARPSVYHEAILAGLAFLLPSWYYLLKAYGQPQPSRRALVISGVLMALAIGGRITLLGYAGATALVLLALVIGQWGSSQISRARDLLAYCAPIGVMGILLGWYNLARFGSAFDFGTAYQLAGVPMAPYHLGSYLSENFTLYLAAIPKLVPGYPYFRLFWGDALVFPNQRQLHVNLEPPLVSPFLLAPVALLSLAVPFVARAWKRAPSILIVSVLCGTPVTILCLSTSEGVDGRYYGDIAPALTLVGSLVLLHWTSSFRGEGAAAVLGRACSSTFAVLSWLISLGFGLTLGFAIWQDSFPEAAKSVKATADDLSYGLATQLDQILGNGGYLEAQLLVDVSAARVQNPLTVDYTSGMRLDGWSILPVRSPEGQRTVRLRLFWEARSTPNFDYSAYLRLAGPSGFRLSGPDHGPGLQVGVLPHLWQPGQLIPDDWKIEVPADAPSGKYTMTVGVYDYRDLKPIPTVGGQDSIAVGVLQISGG